MLLASQIFENHWIQFSSQILVAGPGRAIGSWHSSRGVSAGNFVCYSAAVTVSVCSMKKIPTSS